MTRPKVILDRVEGSSVLGAKDSITVDGTDSKVLLVNDQTTPGNSKMYGTSSSGNKGWITKADIALDNVDNTSDANKPVSTATQTALDGKLSLSGGTMSGAIAMGSNQITGLANGSNPGDVVNKSQLDSAIAGLTHFKKLSFTGWNMDTTSTKSVLHGISDGKVNTICILGATILSNSGQPNPLNQINNLTSAIQGGWAGAIQPDSFGGVNLWRLTGGIFDDPSSNNAGGFVYISYEV